VGFEGKHMVKYAVFLEIVYFVYDLCTKLFNYSSYIAAGSTVYSRCQSCIVYMYNCTSHIALINDNKSIH